MFSLPFKEIVQYLRMHRTTEETIHNPKQPNGEQLVVKRQTTKDHFYEKENMEQSTIGKLFKIQKIKKIKTELKKRDNHTPLMKIVLRSVIVGKWEKLYWK
jgi:hypothetical protein